MKPTLVRAGRADPRHRCQARNAERRTRERNCMRNLKAAIGARRVAAREDRAGAMPCPSGNECGMLDDAISALFEADLHGADGRLVFQPSEAATARGKQLRISTAGRHQADSFPRVSDLN
ncbi:hypothetical protein [Bradyrhizobium sp. RD5-C2]|uniref:hypothetical protein n=1 Tax=Bradyrhizobium sp. RD5-C2 TaxID=244562 RepID=UPI001CC5FC2E|nr:hypothetical protein [Bradyrhizobium sp. RD5-C2]